MAEFPSEKIRFSSTKVTVFVPSTNAKQKFIGSKKFQNRIRTTQNFLTKGRKPFQAFGGTTTIKSVGTFKSGNKVIRERIGLVSAYVPKDKFSKSDRKALNSFFRDKRKTWGQIALSVGHQTKTRPEGLYFYEEENPQEVKEV